MSSYAYRFFVNLVTNSFIIVAVDVSLVVGQILRNYTKKDNITMLTRYCQRSRYRRPRVTLSDYTCKYFDAVVNRKMFIFDIILAVVLTILTTKLTIDEPIKK